MNPLDNVVGRLQAISDRIAQIQAQSRLPPSLRGAAGSSPANSAGASAATDSAASANGATANSAASSLPASSTAAAVRRSGSVAASGSSAAPDPSAALASVGVDRFQTLLDQALSLGDTDPVSGVVSGALSASAPTDDLQRYQEMLLDAIREASGSGDVDA